MVRSLLMSLGDVAALRRHRRRGRRTEVGADTTPPVFANGLLSPSTLPYEGGNSQISVDIIDETELHSTYAQVFGSDGTYQSIYLYQGNGSTYYGTLEAAANYSDGTVSYSVEVQAYDAFHNYNAGYIGEVQVEGRRRSSTNRRGSADRRWTATFLPADGGTVTIDAEAGDNRGLSAVYATVTPVSGGSDRRSRPQRGQLQSLRRHLRSAGQRRARRRPNTWSKSSSKTTSGSRVRAHRRDDRRRTPGGHSRRPLLQGQAPQARLPAGRSERLRHQRQTRLAERRRRYPARLP